VPLLGGPPARVIRSHARRRSPTRRRNPTATAAAHSLLIAPIWRFSTSPVRSRPCSNEGSAWEYSSEHDGGRSQRCSSSSGWVRSSQTSPRHSDALRARCSCGPTSRPARPDAAGRRAR